MRMRRAVKSVSVFLVVCMLVSAAAFTTGAAAGKNSFTTYEYAEKYTIEKGIFQGDGNGNYFFNDNVKRGDVIVLIVRALQFKTDSSFEGFKDVPETKYYSDAIKTMRHFGIARGDGTNFFPERNGTLQEALLLGGRSMDSAEGSLIDGGSVAALEALFGTRSTDEYATRDDIAAMLYYVLTGLSPDKDYAALAAGIKYTTDSNKAVAFKAEDFAGAALGTAPEFVRFTLPATASGKLFYKFGTSSSEAVTAATGYYLYGTPDVSKVSFMPSEDYEGTLSITYKAYNAQGALLYTATVEITVAKTVAVSQETISYSTSANTPVFFNVRDFTAVSQQLTSDALSYVIFTLPSPIVVKLTFTVGASEPRPASLIAYYLNGTAALSNIGFAPDTDYSGSVTITYRAYNAKNDLLYTAKVVITITSAVKTTGVVTYRTEAGKPAAFNITDFNDAATYHAKGAFSYIKFGTVSPSLGKLIYRNGSGVDVNVTSATQYYSSKTPYISEISFVPANGYNGTASLTYTAYNASNQLLYTGIIRITVIAASAAVSDTVRYKLDSAPYVTFNADDFARVCLYRTGKELSSVKFTLPPSGDGRRYYKFASSAQTAVNANTEYFVNTSPSISNISFVPDEDARGTISITYKAYGAAEGLLYTGIVEIKLGVGVAETISYTTDAATLVTFRVSDFTRTAAGATDEALSYVIFTTPPYNQGDMVYNIGQDTAGFVTDTTRYYVSKDPSVGGVSFIPNASFAGKASIPYKAYDEEGALIYTGTVDVTVRKTGSGAVSSDTILYRTNNGAAARFDDVDFTAVCAYLASAALAYVQFKLPPTTSGKLYYNYQTSTQAPVLATTNYYVNDALYLKNVSFVPSDGFKGTVDITYRAYNAHNELMYTAVVKIEVTGEAEYVAPQADVITLQTSNDNLLNLSPGDLMLAVVRVTNDQLAYITFTAVPPSTSGNLYSLYSAVGSVPIIPTVKYYMENFPEITFVPNNTFVGTIVITYQAYNSSNNLICTGSIVITVTD